ncbi:MAG: GMC family oxidoreductase [Stenotrophobium sp.]
MSTENTTMQNYDYDFIIIGSGFGGSVSAHRLTEKGYSVGVMEMGRRWTPENLPSTNWKLWDFFWKPMIGMRGFFNLRFFSHVMVAHGNAVGGGSITYGNTLLIPPDKIWNEGSWAGLDDWQKIMPAHFNTARRMLGVTTNKILGPADYALKKAADEAGCGDTFYRTEVGVFFGDEKQPQGKLYKDPYFDGAGPDRNSCIACGGCLTGCRYNAKNTLDKNYLYLAEKNGAKVYETTKVVDVKPLNGKADGADGYEVHTVDSLSWFGANPRRFIARNVVFAAASLGTQALMFDLKEKGSLPNISDQLGKRVRTNAESIIVVRAPGSKEEMWPGIAIGSGIHIDEHTHVEANRYAKGSDYAGSMFTLMVNGKAGWTRILLWLWTLITQLLTHPIRTLRALNPIGFARESILFLVMQTIEGHLNMRWRRPWYNPFIKVLQTEGEPIPTYIPQANAFAAKMAKSMGGVAMSMTTEILFNIPTTAHCMGGAGMGTSTETGVIDAQNRVFGYQNLYVCDASMLGANLGVNPSLTITALAERAMSFIPLKDSN